ncbi:hypothetical protein SsS58_08508 [Streptomyces scabiei]|uniref:Uncharacterized protein n=1 Tax=Streptomyces scabiei TaxID=1930 RepID=A0A100JYI4_STRSC|nr:hypothetical protein SsS58_08508 [Streptomyces scabiei]
MAGADPAEVAQRVGNSVEVLSRYAKYLYDRQPINSQRIEGLLSSYDQPPTLSTQRLRRCALPRQPEHVLTVIALRRTARSRPQNPRPGSGLYGEWCNSRAGSDS